MERINKYLDQLVQLAVTFAPKLLLAGLVLAIGWWLTSRITQLATKTLAKSQVVNAEIKAFLSSLLSIGLKILLLISVAGIAGIETTSFVGIIAAMGFAVGLALQGNLSNFAAGLLLMVLRPIKVGDDVNIQGHMTTVKEIQMFHTIFANTDGSLIIMPNNTVTGGTIHNFSSTGIRKVKVRLNVPYSEDVLKVKQILSAAGKSVGAVDKERTPFFAIKEFNDHCMKISIAFRITIPPGYDYYDIEAAVNEAIVLALAEHKIQVAYPSGVAFGQFGTPREHSDAYEAKVMMAATAEGVSQ